MVRLKAKQVKYELIPSQISIPYGSIKRTATEKRNTRRNISIPYGSIKSSFVAMSLNPYNISIPYGSIKSNNEAKDRSSEEFQFLMVRLKVNQH